MANDVRLLAIQLTEGWYCCWQVAAELQKLDISKAAIDAIFDVVQLSDVTDLGRLLGENSEVLLRTSCCRVFKFLALHHLSDMANFGHLLGKDGESPSLNYIPCSSCTSHICVCTMAAICES